MTRPRIVHPDLIEMINALKVFGPVASDSLDVLQRIVKWTSGRQTAWRVQIHEAATEAIAMIDNGKQETTVQTE